MKNLPTYEEYLNESQADKLSVGISKSMDKIDPNISYEDFAKAVGKILRDDYGKHNYEKFMKVLHEEIGMK